MLLTVCRACQSIVIAPRSHAGSVTRCPNCSREIDLAEEETTEEQVRECLRKSMPAQASGQGEAQ